MTKYFVLYNHGLPIRGRAYLPDTGQQAPAVILSHEFGMNTFSTARYAGLFCRLGYAVFLFDFCGSGAGISGGRSVDMTLRSEKEDLSRVFDYVRSLDGVDSRRITLLGCSQGGLISALLAAERADEVERLILCYPALCIPDDARRGSMLGSRFSPDRLPERFRALYVCLGRGYIESALSLEPWREICSYPGPVLLLHGDRDRIVPLRYALTAGEKYSDCRLIVLKNARHLFPIIGFGKAIAAIHAFLSETDTT